MTSAEDPDGFETPYAKFLERHLDEIDEILARLLLKRALHQLPDNKIFDEIEEWMGDDWSWSLSEENQHKLEEAVA